MAQPILLSEIIIQNPETSSFYELLDVIRKRAGMDDKFLLDLDLKPDYPDTPRDWAMHVEAAFVYRDD